METDGEQQLYKDVSELREKLPNLQKELKAEIKSTKQKLTKLSNRIEAIELIGFQDQITALDNKVNAFDTKLVDISLALVYFEMRFLQLRMKKAINDHLSNSVRQRLREKIVSRYSKAHEAAKNSKDVSKTLKILKDFRKECEEISKEYKLKAFTS